MKQLNRTLLTLVLAIGVVLIWSALSRTGWAASVSLLGAGKNYATAIRPLIEVAAMTTVAVTAVQLVRHLSALVGRRRRQLRVSRTSAGRAAS